MPYSEPIRSYKHRFRIGHVESLSDVMSSKAEI